MSKPVLNQHLVYKSWIHTPPGTEQIPSVLCGWVLHQWHHHLQGYLLGAHDGWVGRYGVGYTPKLLGQDIGSNSDINK